LGRFTSGDTVIQSLAATASINPYAYAWNGPLKYVDPNGYSVFGDIVGAIVGIVVGCFTFGVAAAWFEGLGEFWGGAAAAAFSGFVGGFTGALLATGSLSAALSTGLISGVTAGLFNGVGSLLGGNSNWQIAERTLAHGFVGCASAAASGGNCGNGALAAAVTEAANSTVMKGNEFASWGHDGQLAARTALSGLIGGTADRILGGNFVEGFSIAAAGYLYNTEAHQRESAFLKAKIFEILQIGYDTQEGFSIDLGKSFSIDLTNKTATIKQGDVSYTVDASGLKSGGLEFSFRRLVGLGVDISPTSDGKGLQVTGSFSFDRPFFGFSFGGTTTISITNVFLSNSGLLGNAARELNNPTGRCQKYGLEC
jgi:hypothetical protein